MTTGASQLKDWRADGSELLVPDTDSVVAGVGAVAGEVDGVGRAGRQDVVGVGAVVGLEGGVQI